MSGSPVSGSPLSGSLPFTLTGPTWDQPDPRPAVLDLRSTTPAPARSTRLGGALAVLGEHWWVGDYGSDAPNRHRDAPDTAALVAQIRGDFAHQPKVQVRWTGSDLLVEAGRWRLRPLACFAPLNPDYQVAATLLATLPGAPVHPARDAMEFDPPVSRVAAALLAGAGGDPARVLSRPAGSVSGIELLGAVQERFRALPAPQWQQVQQQARGWSGSLAALESRVSAAQAGRLPTF